MLCSTSGPQSLATSLLPTMLAIPSIHRRSSPMTDRSRRLSEYFTATEAGDSAVVEVDRPNFAHPRRRISPSATRICSWDSYAASRLYSAHSGVALPTGDGIEDCGKDRRLPPYAHQSDCSDAPQWLNNRQNPTQEWQWWRPHESDPAIQKPTPAVLLYKCPTCPTQRTPDGTALNWKPAPHFPKRNGRQEVDARNCEECVLAAATRCSSYNRS